MGLRSLSLKPATNKIATFNGVNSGTLFPSTAWQWEYTQAFTINFWLNIEYQIHDPGDDPNVGSAQVLIGNMKEIYDEFGNNIQFQGWAISLEAQGMPESQGTTLLLQIANSLTSRIGHYSNWFPYNTLTMCTVAYDGSGLVSGIHTYVNGVASDFPTGTWPYTLSGSTVIPGGNPAWLGYLYNFVYPPDTGPDHNYWFKGQMNNVPVWLSMLTPIQIANLYALGRFANPSEVLAPSDWYVMTTLTGLADQAGNINGTPSNITYTNPI